MQQKGYYYARDKYHELRNQSYSVAHDALPKVITNKKGIAILKSDIALKELDFQTYQNLKIWKDSGQRVAQWDWEKVRKMYKSHPKRFEVSIWHKKQFLCGVSIGKPTISKSKLRLDFIEANPLGSPLHGTITDIVITSGRVYAKAIGATQIRIMHPINERVRDYYMSKAGFSYDKNGDFCFQEI